MKQHLNPIDLVKPNHYFKKSNSVHQKSDDKQEPSTLVEHAFTIDLKACVKFNVIIHQIGPQTGPRNSIKR
jgi:hypothetical protein